MNLPSAVLAKLLEKGLTLADVVELTAIWEADTAPAPPSANALRQRRFRANKSGGVTKTVIVTRDSNATAVSPTPPSEDTPFPPLKGGTSPIFEAPQPDKPNAEPAKPLSAWVSEIWTETPKPGRARSGRQAVERALRAAVRKGADPAAVAAGLRGYYASEDATKDSGKYAKGIDTAISSGRWESFSDPDDGPPPEDDPWRSRLLNWNVNQYWNSEWGPKPGKPGYQGPEAMERAA